MRSGALPLVPENPQVGDTPPLQRTVMSMKAVRVTDTEGSSTGKLMGVPGRARHHILAACNECKIGKGED